LVASLSMLIHNKNFQLFIYFYTKRKLSLLRWLNSTNKTILFSRLSPFKKISILCDSHAWTSHAKRREWKPPFPLPSWRPW
jgi:hypothetical protein